MSSPGSSPSASASSYYPLIMSSTWDVSAWLPPPGGCAEAASPSSGLAPASIVCPRDLFVANLKHVPVGTGHVRQRPSRGRKPTWYGVQIYEARAGATAMQGQTLGIPRFVSLCIACSPAMSLRSMLKRLRRFRIHLPSCRILELTIH